MKGRQHSRWDKQSGQRYFPDWNKHTAPNATGHTCTEYLLDAEHYCEPADGQGSSSRGHTWLQVAHRLGSRGNHDREGDTCTEGRRGQIEATDPFCYLP